jgi:hypothetical protein
VIGPAEYANCLRNSGGTFNDGDTVFYNWSEFYNSFTTAAANPSWVNIGAGSGIKIVSISCGISVSSSTGSPFMALYVNGSSQNSTGSADSILKDRSVRILPGTGNYALTATLFLNDNSIVDVRIIGGSVTLEAGTNAYLSCFRVK